MKRRIDRRRLQKLIYQDFCLLELEDHKRFLCEQQGKMNEFSQLKAGPWMASEGAVQHTVIWPNG